MPVVEFGEKHCVSSLAPGVEDVPRFLQLVGAIGWMSVGLAGVWIGEFCVAFVEAKRLGLRLSLALATRYH